MAQDKKFDRQIRIWGTHGQSELQSAKVCLLHAGPTGSETLKNLVLGGIAAFTIVDDAEVLPSFYSSFRRHFVIADNSCCRQYIAAVWALLSPGASFRSWKQLPIGR